LCSVCKTKNVCVDCVDQSECDVCGGSYLMCKKCKLKISCNRCSKKACLDCCLICLDCETTLCHECFIPRPNENWCPKCLVKYLSPCSNCLQIHPIQGLVKCQQLLCDRDDYICHQCTQQTKNPIMCKWCKGLSQKIQKTGFFNCLIMNKEDR
jgi:hypothetical protein